jgi:small ligand-binding sensory domain FIST
VLYPSPSPNHLQRNRRRQRASQNLTVALAPDDFKPAGALGPSDFLVRGLAGFDPSAGVLLVGGGARLVRPACAAPTAVSLNTPHARLLL